MTLLEVPVDAWSSVEAARVGGADRLELCSSLDLDGLTPNDELVQRALAMPDALPAFGMVRPRPGDFVHDAAEQRAMLADVERLAGLGVQGIVTGVLTPDDRVDVEATARLVEAARPLPTTFHRAFDRVADPARALEQLVEIGVRRILTSGGAARAWEGRGVLRSLVELAGDRLIVMPGGGVRADHAAALVEATGAREIHSSTPFRVG